MDNKEEMKRAALKLRDAARKEGVDFASNTEAHMAVLKSHINILVGFDDAEKMQEYLESSLMSMYAVEADTYHSFDVLQHCLELYHIAPTSKIRGVIIKAQVVLVKYIAADIKSDGKLSKELANRIITTVTKEMEDNPKSIDNYIESLRKVK